MKYLNTIDFKHLFVCGFVVNGKTEKIILL